MRSNHDKTQPHPELMKTAEAAAFLRVSPHFLHRARSRGYGPRFLRFGGAVRYRRDDLLDYIAESIVDTDDTRDTQPHIK